MDDVRLETGLTFYFFTTVFVLLFTIIRVVLELYYHTYYSAFLSCLSGIVMFMALVKYNEIAYLHNLKVNKAITKKLNKHNEGLSKD